MQTITSKPLQNDIKILSFQVWKEGRREEGRGGERSTNKTVTTRRRDKKNDHFHWYCPESLVEVTVCITTNPFASPLSPSYFSPAFLSFLWFLTMCSERCFPLTPSSSCSPCSFPLFCALLLFLIMYSAYFEPTCFPLRLQFHNQFNIGVEYPSRHKPRTYKARSNGPLALPPALTHITFGTYFEILPSTLTHLTLAYRFNHPANAFPSALTHLTFGAQFNHPVTSLPPALIHLIFGEDFNQPVDTLPQTLTLLRFGNQFNHPVGTLPRTLTLLKFGSQFNHPVDTLPPTLIHLFFGAIFNQQINYLPLTLRDLCFAGSSIFNQPVDNLPHKLTHLSSGWEFNHPVNRLPPGLAHLSFGEKFNQSVSSFHSHSLFSP